MEPRQQKSATPWLVAAGVALAFALCWAAALSALGALFVGLQLIACELRAQGSRKLLRPEDLTAPGSPLAERLAGLDAAARRAYAEGALRGLRRGQDGFYLDGRGGRGDDLNLRLARLFVARQQLALDLDRVARSWGLATAWRDVSRLAALLFIGALIGMCLFERPSATAAQAGAPELAGLRLAASALAILAGLAAMRLVSRSAAAALVERLWQGEPVRRLGAGGAHEPDDAGRTLKWRLLRRASPPAQPPPLGGYPAWAGRNHYQILGLDREAEPFLLDPVYRAQMRQRHPDRGGDTAHAQAINEAYRVLRDPVARARYDEELARGAPADPEFGERVLSATAGRRGGWARAAYVGLGAALILSGASAVRAPMKRAAGAWAGAARAQTAP